VDNVLVRKRLTRTLTLAVLALIACSGADRSLERRIAAQGRRAAGTTVSLGSLTEFPWERLYIFPPYTSREVIDRELGFTWKQASRTGIARDDGIALLVFVDAGKVVRYVVQPRSDGDFAAVKTPGGLSRADAVFTVAVNGAGRRVFHR
jgi:hypothetical protein